MENKQKGSIDLGLVIIGLIVLLLIVSFVFQVKRFSAVDNAQTNNELKDACSKYDMSSINDVPQKCFPYMNSLNVNVQGRVE